MMQCNSNVSSLSTMACAVVPSTQPLHLSSNNYDASHSAVVPPLSRRMFQRSKAPMKVSLAILFVIALACFPTANAKIVLVPQKASTQQNHLLANPKLTKSDSTANKKIILQPRPKSIPNNTPKASIPLVVNVPGGNNIVVRPKAKTEQQTIPLQATLTKNEAGESVFALSEESVSALQSAMEQENNPSSKLEEKEEVTVLFYEPADLPKTKPGEAPIIPKVFNENGDEVDVTGKEVFLVPPKNDDPKPLPKQDDVPPSPVPDESEEKTNTESTTDSSSTTKTTGNKSSTTSQSTKDTNSTSSSRKLNFHMQNPQAQDQMIIISTVATMALLVGALSARRLRSRQFLSFCIENESLEDEMAYDAAYTTQSTVGASSLYGGGYDTFASAANGERYGGDLRWRGDLEKFDV